VSVVTTTPPSLHPTTPSCLGYDSFWQDGTAGALVALHAWMYQQNGGLRAMTWCFTGGMLLISLPFLIADNLASDNFNDQVPVPARPALSLTSAWQGSQVRTMMMVNIILHIIPLVTAMGACCFSEDQMGSWKWLQPRHGFAAMFVGVYAIVNALIRLLEFQSAEYSDDGSVGQCDEKCNGYIAVMHLLTYLPFPIVIYSSLRWDTTWWSSIDICLRPPLLPSFLARPPPALTAGVGPQ
jgi:hypothetical protein